MQNVKLIGAELGDQILSVLAPILNQLTTWLKSLTQWFSSLDDGTKTWIVQIGMLVSTIGPALLIFGAMAKGISNIIKGFKDVKEFGGKAVNLIKDFGSKTLDGAKKAGDFASKVGGKMVTAIKDSTKALVGLIKQMVIAIANFVTLAAKAAWATVKFIAHKAVTIASTVATTALSLAQAALNFIMSLNPITLIVIAIGALVAAIIVLWNKCEWFRNLIMGLFEALKTAWNATIEFFKQIWQSFIDTWNSAIQWVKDVWNTICQFFKDMWNGVCQFFVNLWQYFVNSWNYLVQQIKNTWNAICQFFKDIWSGVCTTIGNVWTAFKTKFNDIVNGIRSIWSNVCNFFGTAWTNACTGVKNVFTNVKNTVVGIAQSMTNSVIRAINWCINQLNKLSFTVPSWVPGIGGKSWGVKIPNVSEVRWLYQGGIINSPTIFGNIGVGDAYKGKGRQAEAIIPLEVMYRKMENIVGKVIDNKTNRNNDTTINQGSRDIKIEIKEFNNNTNTDVDTLVEEIAFKIQRETKF